MIVISGTSCIEYLIILNKLTLLEQNFTNIIIPSGVHKEILALSGKYDLSKYLNADWISIKEITNFELYKNLLKEDELTANTTFRIGKNIYNNVLKEANE